MFKKNNASYFRRSLNSIPMDFLQFITVEYLQILLNYVNYI